MKALLRLTAVGIMVCGLMFASSAQAQMEGGGMRGKYKKKMEERMEKVFSQLGLSEEQQRLLDRNKQRHKAAGEALRNQLKAAMKAMEDEFNKEQLDMAKIDAIRATTKEIRNKMMDEKFMAILEVRKILTRDQFLKFTALIKQYKEAEQRHDKP